MTDADRNELRRLLDAGDMHGVMLVAVRGWAAIGTPGYSHAGIAVRKDGRITQYLLVTPVNSELLNQGSGGS